MRSTYGTTGIESVRSAGAEATQAAGLKIPGPLPLHCSESLRSEARGAHPRNCTLAPQHAQSIWSADGNRGPRPPLSHPRSHRPAHMDETESEAAVQTGSTKRKRFSPTLEVIPSEDSPAISESDSNGDINETLRDDNVKKGVLTLPFPAHGQSLFGGRRLSAATVPQGHVGAGSNMLPARHRRRVVVSGLDTLLENEESCSVYSYNSTSGPSSDPCGFGAVRGREQHVIHDGAKFEMLTPPASSLDVQVELRPSFWPLSEVGSSCDDKSVTRSRTLRSKTSPPANPSASSVYSENNKSASARSPGATSVSRSECPSPARSWFNPLTLEGKSVLTRIGRHCSNFVRRRSVKHRSFKLLGQVRRVPQEDLFKADKAPQVSAAAPAMPNIDASSISAASPVIPSQVYRPLASNPVVSAVARLSDNSAPYIPDHETRNRSPFIKYGSVSIRGQESAKMPPCSEMPKRDSLLPRSAPRQSQHHTHPPARKNGSNLNQFESIRAECHRIAIRRPETPPSFEKGSLQRSDSLFLDQSKTSREAQPSSFFTSWTRTQQAKSPIPTKSGGLDHFHGISNWPPGADGECRNDRLTMPSQINRTQRLAAAKLDKQTGHDKAASVSLTAGARGAKSKSGWPTPRV